MEVLNNLNYPKLPSLIPSDNDEILAWYDIGGVFALRAHCALLLDYIPPEEPPSTPLGNALRIR